MTRRSCLRATLCLLAVLPGLAAAQAGDRVFRIGILRPTAAPLSPTDPILVALPDALRQLGYIAGRNLIIAWRFAGGNPQRLPALARELVEAKVDVIVAVSAPAVLAARQASDTSPIVMFGNFDPAALGLVASLDDANRRVASFVDRILRGAKPLELPIERPSKFEFVINLKTARTMGIEIPHSLRLRADEVIR